MLIVDIYFSGVAEGRRFRTQNCEMHLPHASNLRISFKQKMPFLMTSMKCTLFFAFYPYLSPHKRHFLSDMLPNYSDFKIVSRNLKSELKNHKPLLFHESSKAS